MKMDNPTTITVVGSIIAAIVLAVFGLLAGNVQKKQSDADKTELLDANEALGDTVKMKNEELARKSDDHTKNLELYANKLEVYANRLDQYATEQKAKDKEVIDLQKKLNEAQAKLTEAQEKTIANTEESLKYLTGGDSYCFISLYGFAQSDHEIRVNLFHHGKYPLSALHVNITRVSAIHREAGSNGPMVKFLSMSGAHKKNFPVGPLPSSPEPFDLGTLPFEPKVQETFFIKYFAQNGTWTQRYDVTYDENNYPKVDSKLFIKDKVIDMGYIKPKALSLNSRLLLTYPNLMIY